LGTLETLIRLSQNRTEERQRVLKAALEAEAATEARIAALDGRVASEKKAATEDELLRADFPNFLVRARAERLALLEDLEKRRKTVAMARDTLAEAFEEQKKYEISKDMRDARDAAERGRKEQAFLDEVALRRKSEGR